MRKPSWYVALGTQYIPLNGTYRIVLERHRGKLRWEFWFDHIGKDKCCGDELFNTPTEACLWLMNSMITEREVFRMDRRYVRRIAEVFPYRHYEDPPICRVELWDFSEANDCEEARIEAVTTVASISYGNEVARNPRELYHTLIRKGHESPFEFVPTPTPHDITRTLRDGGPSLSYSAELIRKYIATFRLKVPIFVARQIMRHRSFRYMELSRRYVKGDKVPFEFWRMDEDAVKELVDEYDEMLEEGVKPEVARVIFPLATYTQFWMQGDYRAWFNFFVHRLSPDTQAETRLVAEAMWKLLCKYQNEFVYYMLEYGKAWVEEGNPVFKESRKAKLRQLKMVASYLDNEKEEKGDEDDNSAGDA